MIKDSKKRESMFQLLMRLNNVPYVQLCMHTSTRIDSYIFPFFHIY